MPGRRWSFLIANMLVCAACSTPDARLPPLPQDAIEAELRRQQIAHIRDYYSQVHRLDTVAFRLRVANRKDCKRRVSPQIGFYAATPQSLPRRYRSYAREALDITWARPTLISVVDGSPAALAGLRIGDEVTALDGDLIPVHGTAEWIAGWLRRNGVAPVQVDYRRAGAYLTTTLIPVMGCAIPIELQIADEANALTTDRKITFYSGLLTLAKTDAELAYVVGHELAHSNLGHLDKRQFNSTLGGIGGTIVDGGFLLAGLSTGGAFAEQFEKAGAQAYSVGFEREADYVGAYYAARADYAIEGIENFERASGLAHPDTIRKETTHPTAPVRVIQLRKTAAEIADKKRRGLPLEPDLRLAYEPPNPSADVTH